MVFKFFFPRECLVTPNHRASKFTWDLSAAQNLKYGGSFAKLRMVNIDMSVPILVAYETERSSITGYRALKRSLVSLSMIISVACVVIADVEETTECAITLVGL